MKNSGFTLVELVMVMIMIGVLAAVAIPRMFQRETFDARGFFDQVQAMLRYAQKVAIAERRDVYVRLDGASIALCFDNFVGGCGVASRVPAPSRRNSGSTATLAACGNSSTWFCEAVPTGVTTTATTFYFGALGKPFNPPPASSFSTLAISIVGDGTTRNILVEQETGYVHAQP